MLYFAYGSNLWQPRLESRVGEVTALSLARLENHELRWHKVSNDRSGKCDVVPSDDGEVLGVVYEVLDDKVMLLDRAEGAGRGYVRTSMSVVASASTIGVMSYRAASSHIDPDMVPYDWYRDIVVAGARMHGLPREYIDRLASTAAKPDSDVVRSAKERSLLLIGSPRTSRL
jgi:gamma-glutamylcyclotransferase